MTNRSILLAIVLFFLVSNVGSPALAQDCDATDYIAQMEDDMATTATLLLDGSPDAYLTISGFYDQYLLKLDVPECAVILHQNAIQWFDNARNMATLSRNITNEVEQLIDTDAWYQLYFTQVINSRDEADHTGAAVEDGLIDAILNAQNTIDAALFELNAPDTTAALLLALERGVRVRILADDEHNLEDPESTIEQLIAAGAEVVSDERSALMHSKFFVFDSQSVWTGSMNITRNGMYNNNNNAIYIESPELAANYIAEFNEMFVDHSFSSRANPRPVMNRSVTVQGTQVETYFSPEDGDAIEARVVELINEADTSVRVMAFSFTLGSIGDAMIKRMGDGLIVEGVFETTGSLRGQLTPLACAGADVRQDGNPNILHHKAFIIDNEIVVTGSFNFSASARDNNTENVLIIHNPMIASAFTNEWKARFAEGRVPPEGDVDCS